MDFGGHFEKMAVFLLITGVDMSTPSGMIFNDLRNICTKFGAFVTRVTFFHLRARTLRSKCGQNHYTSDKSAKIGTDGP